ncbi:MAG: hypothetical protein OQJ99_01155 [Rhodospirillales bacterium]|nr:hypothetical protein [Rhodospirillales bacterium]MCW8862168.1 hypothetical protein [Rhodospirillales bacterium]MCW8952302.1 hypothetical protein [Rhodospirillales bacterium]
MSTADVSRADTQHAAVSSALVQPVGKDPHSIKPGFFDIHICNWTDRERFVFALFSSRFFADIAKIEIFAPDGGHMGDMDLGKYRYEAPTKDRGEKRIYIKFFDLPEKQTEGWYTTHVTMKDGSVHLSKDWVMPEGLPLASGLTPPDGATDIPIPEELTWNPIPGARFYKVFIRDGWQDGKLLYQSRLLPEPRLVLPKGLLQPGGMYLWRVHARDMNENPVWGDFNSGSLSAEIEFSVK